MKKIVFIFLGLLALSQCGKCQDDKTFTQNINVVSITYPDHTIQTTAGVGVVDWASITNKPNFVALYKPINYVPAWAEITGKPVLFSGNYTDLAGKPTLFSGSYTDLTNKPAEVDLVTAIPQLPYLGIPSKTTAEINSLVIPAGVIAIVWDKTLGVLKLWNGTIWKIYPTTN
jgi:hypothetical protein